MYCTFEYPYKEINDKLYMFYNGNGFGETGIALTTMEIKNLC